MDCIGGLGGEIKDSAITIGNFRDFVLIKHRFSLGFHREISRLSDDVGVKVKLLAKLLKASNFTCFCILVHACSEELGRLLVLKLEFALSTFLSLVLILMLLRQGYKTELANLNILMEVLAIFAYSICFPLIYVA